MKFIKNFSFDNDLSKELFAAGDMKLQKGNWITYNGTKGRIMSGPKEGYFEAVFPGMETARPSLPDVRAKLRPFQDTKMIFSYQSAMKLPRGGWCLFGIRHSWGEYISDHLNIAKSNLDRTNFVPSETGGTFFGYVVKYRLSSRMGILVDKFSHPPHAKKV